MSNDFRANSSALTDYKLKNNRLVCEVAITSNATPASKTHASDVPGAVVLRTEGKTSEADAIESLTGQVTAPVDSTGKFAVLIDDASVQKFLKASVTPSTGTIAVTKVTTTGKRLALDLDSSVDLSTTSLTILIEVDYEKSN